MVSLQMKNILGRMSKSMSSSQDGESEDECEGGSVEEDDDTNG